jgi:predicted amidophosphoribosyltransferase
MGELIARRFAKPNVDFLIPVPLHKYSERDYNQAEFIARGAGSVWRIPVKSPLSWRRGSLRQALKSGVEDRNLPEDVITGSGLPGGASVFIVDDVFTSGSTIRAAARALEGLGASVNGAVVWSKSGGSMKRYVDRAV